MLNNPLDDFNKNQYNTQSMQNIILFAYNESSSNNTKQKFIELLTNSNEELLNNPNFSKENIIQILEDQIEQKKDLYNEFLNLQIQKNILQTKLNITEIKDTYFQNIESKIEKIQEKLKNFPYDIFELQGILSQEQFNKLLDKIEPDEVKMLRNFNYDLLSEEKLQELINLKRIHAEEILKDYLKKTKENFLANLSDDFEENLLELLSEKLSLKNKNTEIVEHDSLLTLAKRIWNTTITPSAKLTTFF